MSESSLSFVEELGYAIINGSALFVDSPELHVRSVRRKDADGNDVIAYERILRRQSDPSRIRFYGSTTHMHIDRDLDNSGPG